MRGVKPGEELSTLHRVGDEVAGGVIIEIVEEVGNYHAKVQCKACGKVTKSNTQRLNSGRMCSCQKTAACSEAAKERKQKSRDEFPVGTVNAGREVVGYHVNSFGKTLLEVKCVACGKEGRVQFGDYRKGIGCPCNMYEKAGATCMERFGVVNPFAHPDIHRKCMETQAINLENSDGRSGPELEVNEFIRSMGLKPKPHVIEGKGLDIFVAERGIGVEFNGVFYHSERHGRGADYHLWKTDRAKVAGIDLIHLWEDVWGARKEQMKSFLRARLGKNRRRIWVGKCRVVAISKGLCRSFVDTYHINPTVHEADLSLGAYYGDELIAVASFVNSEGTVTLDRVCSKTDCSCVDFIGEVLQKGANLFSSNVVTWVDRCLEDGSVFESFGMAKMVVEPPDYFYVGAGGKTHPKSEVENTLDEDAAHERGFRKVWDCGRFMFEYNKNPA